MGVLLVLISALFFVLSSYYGKIVTSTTEMTAIVTSFSRFLLGTIIMAIYMVSKKKSFKPNNLKPIIFRAVLNSISLILFSWALQFTTITNTNMLHMTYPVFVILLAPYITKETNKKNVFIYLVLIMLGSYIVSNPSFTSINVGDVIALISAVLAGVSVLYLTEARKSNDGYIIVFYVMFIGTFVNIPSAAKDLMNFELSGAIPVFLAALLGFLGQVFLTWGYKYVDSATGSLLSTSRIVIAAVIGFIFLGEPINFRIISGIALITITLIGISGYFDKRINNEVIS